MGVDDCNYVDDIMELHHDLNLGDLSILPSSHEFPESQLCVPPDPLDDLEWFPSFSDDFISLNERSISSDHQNLLVLATTDQHETKGTIRKEGVGISEAEVGGLTKKRGRSKKRKLERNQKAKRGLTAIDGKRCSHCLTDETPQWRVGPLGPKTLCNACGVRFRSGRLLPEYRPAASPTFDGCRHSNYHKKIQKRRGLASYKHNCVV